MKHIVRIATAVGLLLISVSASIGGTTSPTCASTLMARAADISSTASVSATSVVRGGSLDFTCTPAFGVAPHTYEWEFDDPASYAGGVIVTTTQNPSHTFAWPGVHEVRVTITDSLGAKTRIDLPPITVSSDASMVEVDAVADLSLDNTGASDCAAALETWIAANYTSDGLRVLFPPGTYRFDEQTLGGRLTAVHLDSQNNQRHKLEFVGADPTNRPLLRMFSASDAPRGFFHIEGASTSPTNPSVYRLAHLRVEMAEDLSALTQTPEFLLGGDVWSRQELVSIEHCYIRNFGRVTNGSRQRFVRCETAEISAGATLYEQFRFARDGLIRQCRIRVPRIGHSHAVYLSSAQDVAVVDSYFDGDNPLAARLFWQMKSACNGLFLRDNLCRNTTAGHGYAVQLGAYDAQCSNITLARNRFVGPSFGVHVWSSSANVRILENFFAGFLDSDGNGINLGHNQGSGGFNTVGVTITDNVFGATAPSGSGSVVNDFYTSSGNTGPGHTLTFTETGSVNNTTTVLASDPAGWSSAGAYLDPGAFTTTFPTVSSFVVDSGDAETDSLVVTLNSTVSDSGSGMGATARFPFLIGGAMQFSNDGTQWSPAQPVATSQLWTLSPGDGVKTVYARYRNVDGYWSPVVSDTITYGAGSAGQQFQRVSRGTDRMLKFASGNVATSATVDGRVDQSYSTLNVGVQMQAASGDQVVATAGSFAVQVKTPSTAWWETISGASTIDATAPVTLVIKDRNVMQVRVVPTGVTGISTYKVVVTVSR